MSKFEDLMTMSISDKGGRELAAAWLRRGADQRTQGTQARQRPAERDARRPVAKPGTSAVFHSDMHRGFSRA